MYQSPPSRIEGATGKQVLICSAFGNVNEMSGEFQSSTEASLSWTTSRHGNLFKIEINVTESATYICKINNLRRHVEAMSVVDFFTCKDLFFSNFCILLYFDVLICKRFCK